MTRRKSKLTTLTRSRPAKTKRKLSKPPTPHDAAWAAVAKTRAGTKHAQVLAMLQDRATTIAAIMAATGWQQHSVRGFLAGVVRKKLGLNVVSEPGESGRVYRIIDDTASPVKAVKQAA